MDKYINLKGFENTNNGNQLKNSVYYITDLDIIFYDIPLIFIYYGMDDPTNIYENTHIFTELDDFVLFLKKYTDANTSLTYENMYEFLEYYNDIIYMYFIKHNLDIENYLN